MPFLRHRVVVIGYIDVLYQNKEQLLEVFCRTFPFSLDGYSIQISHLHLFYFVCVYNAMTSLSKHWKHGDGKRTRKIKI